MTNVKLSPFWTDDFPRPADLATGAPPPEADVAVVGAGITGLVAARALAAAGSSVAVLDARRLGEGASAVNGGMATYGLKASAARVLQRFGTRLGGELWQAGLDAVDRVEQLVREESIECAFSRPGSAALGFTARDDRNLAGYARWTTEVLGFPIDYVPRNRLSGVIDSGAFSVALTEGFSAGLHPARYTFGLARAALAAGATISENCRVTEVERRGGGFVLGTGGPDLGAGAVLVATNGYTGPEFPHIRRRVVPIGSYCIVTEPLPADLAERLIPGNRMLWTVRRLLNYFRRTPDDRILLGGRRNLRADLDLGDTARDLRRRLLEFFPELATREITHAWGGRLGATFDLLPHIGRRDGVWYAMGYSGHGVPLATYLGGEVAGLISGRLDRSPFADIPHPTRWYYRREPWFLPLGAWGFRLLDRIGR